MLIPSERHTPADLALWAELEEADRANGERLLRSGKVERSLNTISLFSCERPCYAGISWGKDSTVLADIVSRLPKPVPLIWIRVEPIKSPDCALVRDAFLRTHPGVEYDEVEVWCRRDKAGWHASGTLEQGVAECERRWGRRHILGIRARESFGRKIRMLRWGESSTNGCAPLGWWTLADVMAYLAHHDLPVHPAYGMLGGGRWPRDRLRVASLGGLRGAGGGRAEWEQEYYGDVLRRLEAQDAGSGEAVG